MSSGPCSIRLAKTISHVSEKSSPSLSVNAYTIAIDVSKLSERGVKEVIYIKAVNLCLNKDGGRHNTSLVWDNIKRGE